MMGDKMITNNELEQEISNLLQQYTAAIKIVETKLELIDAELKYKYQHSPIHGIQSRIKSISSIKEKLQRKGYLYNINGIKKLNDIAGIRVICNYINDIQYIAQLLVLQDDVNLIKHNNYIQYPKTSGYRSLHLIITVPIYQNDGKVLLPVEIHIRTIAMDCWASLEHELCYKNKNQASDEIKQRLRLCSDMMAKTDQELQKIYLELNQSWNNYNVSRETLIK